MPNLSQSKIVSPSSPFEVHANFDPARTIVIVGAGFSGTMVAVHLLRNGSDDLTHVVLIERATRFARGVAYGTTKPSHLLNVPVGRMSALPDDPDDFLNWAKRQDPSIGGHTFAPRALYGEYLNDLLDQAGKIAAPHVRITRLSDEVVDVRPRRSDGRHIVALKSGKSLAAEQIVLALGNFAPADPLIGDMSFYQSSRYVRDPWSVDALAAIKADEPLLIVGTGLTMIDIVLELRDRGHHAPIHAVSRRGLLPQPHRSPTRPPTYRFSEQDVEAWDKSALGLLRQVRRELKVAARTGDDWREVINALRPVTQKLWRSLDHTEQRRFLRHIRPLWEVHRHRAPNESATIIQAMIDAGRLVIHRGRICSFAPKGEGVEIAIQPRGSNRLERIRAGHVVNATGPETDLSRVRDPLLASLRGRGLIRPDALGLGLDANDEGAVITAEGEAHPAISVIGPLRRGQLWESTAVPELRVEAANLAKRLLARGSSLTCPEGQLGDLLHSQQLAMLS